MMRWYLSFADERFLGACVVRAVDAEHAVVVASERGLNPGGQALVVPVPDDVDAGPLWTLWRTPEEIEAATSSPVVQTPDFPGDPLAHGCSVVEQ